MTRKLVILTAVAGASVALLAVLQGRSWEGPAVAPSLLTIVATNDVQARDRRCGCEGSRAPDEKTVFVESCSCQRSATALTAPALGALPERSAWLARLGPHLSVDSGDLLFPSLDVNDLEREDRARRARLMVECMGLLGLDAYVPGEKDLALGREFFEQTLAHAPFSVVCCNLIDAEKHTRVFPSTKTIPFPGTPVRVGIVGVFDPPLDPVVQKKLAASGLQLLDPVSAVQLEVQALRASGATFVVVLAHQPDARSRELVRRVPGIDAVFGAHADFPVEKSGHLEGQTLLVRTYPGGGTPLVASFQLGTGGSGVVDYNDPAAYLARRARAETAKLTALRGKATDGAELARLDAELEKLRAAESEATRALGGRHVVSLMPTPLVAEDWKAGQDARVLAAIERFKAEGEGATLSPGAIAKAEAPGQDAQGRPSAYATAARCAECHPRQAQVWGQSLHSKAWASLERGKNQKDPECVRCHASGFRAPGGFATVGRAVHPDARGQDVDLRGVQCEACHGPRAAHADQPGATGASLPALATCRGCHDAQHDPTFDAARFEKAIADHAVCARNP